MTVSQKVRGAVLLTTMGALLAALACGGGDTSAARDSLTQRQRDSAIGESPLPGAQGVRGAIRASDSAAARRALEDSIGRRP